MPRFSIVMPCYNAAGLIEQTIASVQEQAFSDWEMILIDDGSTDETPLILARAAVMDQRIRFERQRNAGPSAARNKGARLSGGEIIAFLDADDLWAPDRLSVLDQVFRRETAPDAAFGTVGFFATDPSNVSVWAARPGDVAPLDCLHANPTCTMSNVAVTREAFFAAGGFDERLRYGEDLEWLIRFSHGRRLIGVEGARVYYRASPNGLSANLSAMQAGWRAARDTALALGLDLGPDGGRRAEAAHLRYLARRALRLGGTEALRLAVAGCLLSPRGFFASPFRGAATLIAALIAPLTPRALRRRLFA